jgi:hypothetical protein
MTLDDLIDVFYEAECKGTDRDAIRAVVAALRDEFEDGYEHGILMTDIVRRLDDILGNSKDEEYRCVQGHDLCNQMYAGPECPYCEKKEILADGEVAAGSATAQTEGVTNGGHFQESVSPAQPGRSIAVGASEGLGRASSHGHDGKPEVARAIAGADEARRSRHVGGESNLGVTAVKAAGGPTSNAGQALTSALPTPAADPSRKEWRPVCVWREVNEWWNRSCDGLDVGFYAKPDNTVCGKCLKPIKLKEAAHGE